MTIYRHAPAAVKNVLTGAYTFVTKHCYVCHAWVKTQFEIRVCASKESQITLKRFWSNEGSISLQNFTQNFVTLVNSSDWVYTYCLIVSYYKPGTLSGLAPRRLYEWKLVGALHMYGHVWASHKLHWHLPCNISPHCLYVNLSNGCTDIIKELTKKNHFKLLLWK